MVDVPRAPCDCLSVNPVAIGCSGIVCAVFLSVRTRTLRREQLDNPHGSNRWVAQAADAVLLCDVLKLALGLILSHAILFIHEAVVSSGGLDETQYYFLAHMLRAALDVVVGSVVALVCWKALIRCINYHISTQSIETLSGRHSSALLEALRASGRYNPSYALHWDHDDCIDFRIDQDHPVQGVGSPSVRAQRAEERQRQEDADEDGDDDDVAPSRALQRRSSSLFEPLPKWWYLQTAAWTLIVLVVGFLLCGFQILWREVLGHDDIVMLLLHDIAHVVQKDGNVVCGDGVANGVMYDDSSMSTGSVVLAWLAVIAFHCFLDVLILSFLYSSTRYQGRAAHPMHLQSEVQNDPITALHY